MHDGWWTSLGWRWVLGGALVIGGCFDPDQVDQTSGGTSEGSAATGPGSTSAGMTSSVDPTTGLDAGSASATGSTGRLSTGPESTTSDSGSGSSGSSSSGADSSSGMPASCMDGRVNQDETDVDCGGSICDPCDNGQVCGVASDCLSTSCDAGVCIDYCAAGCLLVASNNAGTVYVYETDTLTEIASFPGMPNVQSVAGGEAGFIYAGASSQVFDIDVTTGAVTPLGAGLLSGFLYGTSVDSAGNIYLSSSSMADVRILLPDGSDGGIVDVLAGSNLRSTTFGPDGSFYLTAFGGNFVERWGPGLIYDGTFGGGGLGSPFGITARSDGTVIVASQNNGAYYVYTAAGAFVSSTAIACGGQVRNVAVDADDTLYVGCYSDGRVAVFSQANVEVDSILVDTPGGVGMLYEWPGPPP
ncbi:MAG: hypothetical protein AAGF11_39050 [Myxococcota bacterium]